jgi:hypothetical protein
MRFLNRIREIVGRFPSEKDLKERKSKRKKAKYETYLAYKPKNHVNSKDQLCWYCEKAGGLCSWSKDFTPVEGWDAEPDTIRNRDTIHRTTKTYYIKSCPEYEPLKMRREILTRKR